VGAEEQRPGLERELEHEMRRDFKRHFSTRCHRPSSSRDAVSGFVAPMDLPLLCLAPADVIQLLPLSFQPSSSSACLTTKTRSAAAPAHDPRQGLFSCRASHVRTVWCRLSKPRHLSRTVLDHSLSMPGRFATGSQSSDEAMPLHNGFVHGALADPMC